MAWAVDSKEASASKLIQTQFHWKTSHLLVVSFNYFAGLTVMHPYLSGSWICCHHSKFCFFQYKVGDFKNCVCVCVYFSIILTSVSRAFCDAALIICGTMNIRVPRDDGAERRSEDMLVPWRGSHQSESWLAKCGFDHLLSQMTPDAPRQCVTDYWQAGHVRLCSIQLLLGGGIGHTPDAYPV